jgi:hypothetical protein
MTNSFQMGLTEGLTLGRDDGRRSPAQIDRSDFPNLGLEVSQRLGRQRGAEGVQYREDINDQ